MLEISIFSVLAIFMLIGSVTMVVQKQTLFSAFGFLIAMIAMAGMFALLDNRFLAIAQIIVSVGAIVVLSMLTILTVNSKDEHLPKEPNKYKWMIFSSILISPFTILLYMTLSKTFHTFSEIDVIGSKEIGNMLFSDWVFPFEIVSILLLTAMIAAIVIARKQTSKEYKL